MRRTLTICDCCCAECAGHPAEDVNGWTVEVEVGQQRDVASGRTENVMARGQLCDECRRNFYADLEETRRKQVIIAKRYGLTAYGLPLDPNSSRGY